MGNFLVGKGFGDTFTAHLETKNNDLEANTGGQFQQVFEAIRQLVRWENKLPS